MSKLLATLRSRLGRATAVFFLANIAAAGIPLLLLPVLTRFLTPEDYGILAMFQVLVGITIPFVGVTAAGAVTRQYFRREELDFPQYVGNAFILMAATGVLVAAVYALLGGLFEQWTGFPAMWMWSVVALAMTNFGVAVISAVWQVESKPRPFAVFYVGLVICELAFALFLIVGQGWNWEGRVVSRVVVTTVFFVLAVTLLRRKQMFDLRLNRDFIRHAVNFGVPLIPHTLGMWAITMADRLFITNMLDVSQTGLYVVGVQIAMAVNLVVSAFASAWTPWFYERLKRDEPLEKRQVVRVTYAANLVFFVIALGVGFVAPPVLEVVVGPQFVDAGTFILTLALGNAFYGCYRLFVGYLFFAETTKIVGGITVLTALVNAGANYVLISANGAIGAAQATLFAYALSATLVWIASSRVHPMPWNLFRNEGSP